MRRAYIVVASLVTLSSPATAQVVPYLYGFTNISDGEHPCPGLVLADKTLYGTTSDGGRGTVFCVNTDGTGFTVLHRFSSAGNSFPRTNSDGAHPKAGLVLSGKALYGTAAEGGVSGLGTVFKLNTDGKGFAVLHNFSAEAASGNKPDGARPVAKLVLAGKTLYGTTERGGYNEGTIFKVNTDGTGFATLHRFSKLVRGRYLTNFDGAFPQTPLALQGNTLYGTAWSGGINGVGTVFKLKSDGSGFTVLHSFSKATNNRYGHESNETGAWIEAGLVVSGGMLYGTSSQGGGAGNGTVFKLKTDGSGFTVLHSFTTHGISSPDITNEDGEGPRDLVLSGNMLYGVASECGKQFWGTIFKVTTDGAGFAVLHSLGGKDGSHPEGGLVVADKTIYGTTAFGGTKGGGTVFKAGVDGSGFNVLHSFTSFHSPPGSTD